MGTTAWCQLIIPNRLRRPLTRPDTLSGVIDAKLLRENPDVVRAALTKRGESTDLVDQILVGRR